MLGATFSAAFGVLLLAFSGAAIDVQPGQLDNVLANAQPGQRLRLQPGVHRGPVVLSKRVAIEGVAGSILEGTGSGNVLTIEADGCEVRGLTVRGSGRDLNQDDAVVLLKEVRDVTVRECVVDARAFGVYVRAGGGHHLVDNIVKGDATLAEVERGNGIHLWHTERNEVRNNRVASTRDGIYLSFAHDNQIVENRGVGLRYGIHYMYSERNTLEGNAFSKSVGGIALMFSKKNRIHDNETSDNQRFGILCQMVESSEIYGNHASGNGRGLFLENSANNVLRHNLIRQNGVGVFMTAGSEGNLLVDNAFDENVVQLYRDHAGNNQWARQGRGNYWSDYAGFDWNADGVGEQPYQMDTGASALMARYPAARWLWRSPLMLLLDWWHRNERQAVATRLDLFPLVTGPGSGG
jgi:nitrous oxidase accessory protein